MESKLSLVGYVEELERRVHVLEDALSGILEVLKVAGDLHDNHELLLDLLDCRLSFLEKLGDEC